MVFATREETKAYTRETRITDFRSIWIEVQNYHMIRGGSWSIGEVSPNEPQVTEEMVASQATYDMRVALDADLHRVGTAAQLHSALLSAGAGQFEAAIRDELGVTKLEDLKHVEQADLKKIGMRGSQIHHLHIVLRAAPVR